jgi:hypothetical protein
LKQVKGKACSSTGPDNNLRCETNRMRAVGQKCDPKEDFFQVFYLLDSVQRKTLDRRTSLPLSSRKRFLFAL